MLDMPIKNKIQKNKGCIVYEFVSNGNNTKNTIKFDKLCKFWYF